MKYLPCPSCGQSKHLRADVFQSVDITINENGDIENGIDFSDPEVNRGQFDCTNCGIPLILEYANRKYQLKEI